jgi:Protein of unknown function (DUF1194)
MPEFSRPLRQTIRRLALILMVCVLALPARAQTAVDLQLVLAVDASGSVNQTRFVLQQQGYADAFRNPKVLNAIHSGPLQAIAVTLFQWTGPRLQVHTVPWMVVRDEASAHAFAAAIEGAPRALFSGGTSISGAIDFGMRILPFSDVTAARRTIDVSGDGSNNAGRPVQLARDDAVAAGVTINGLPIPWLEYQLDRYYYDNVIGGPGAFVISAETYEQFGDAIVRKLILEIAGTPPSTATASLGAVFRPIGKTR